MFVYKKYIYKYELSNNRKKKRKTKKICRGRGTNHCVSCDFFFFFV